jgi:hypothetical protein
MPSDAITNEAGYPALPNLRHLYENMVNGGVKDASSAKQIATGLLGPAIVQLERADADRAKRATADEALLSAAQAVIARWHSPKWKDQEHTGTVINRLHAAVDMHTKAGKIDTSEKRVQKTAVSIHDDEALLRRALAAITLDRHDFEEWPEASRDAIEAIRARLSDSKGDAAL